MPDWLVLLFFIFFPAAGAVALHAGIRALVPAGRLIPHHDVAGFLVAIVGVLYAVVLGFVVVTVWTSFDSVQRTADLEAGYVGDAFGFASMLAEPARSNVRRAVAKYAIEVRDVEWKALERGKQDIHARVLLLEAYSSLAQAKPRDGLSFAGALRSQTIANEVFSSLRDVADSRRLRLIEAEATLPKALYLALVAGGMMVLGFVFLFGVENRTLQFTMTAIVAGCIGLLFGLVVEFNAPYSGALRISPAAWTYVIDNNQFRSVITRSIVEK